MNFFERLISVGRCTKVTKGGRKFSFSAIVVIGNKSGLLGYGTGKASEIIEAKRKAINNAKKTIFKIPIRNNRTVYHKVIGKFSSSKIIIKPAAKGKGILSGGITRSIFDVLGIKDIITKSLGSNNPYNIIRATIDGLLKIESPLHIIRKKNNLKK